MVRNLVLLHESVYILSKAFDIIHLITLLPSKSIPSNLRRIKVEARSEIFCVTHRHKIWETLFLLFLNIHSYVNRVLF